MRKKRITAFFVGLALLLPLFSGCHGKEDGYSSFEVPDTFDTEKEYEITFWAKNQYKSQKISFEK